MFEGRSFWVFEPIRIKDLNYAAVTGKKPAICLICKSGGSMCPSHKLRLEETMRHWDLEVEVFVLEEDEIIKGAE